MSPRPRVPELDGLRGVAVALVVVWHYVAAPFGLNDTATPPVPTAGVEAVFLGPLGLAWSGVDLFFVLSGYLITDILLRGRRADNLFAVFYLRRACRLVPLYALTLAGFWLAGRLLPGSAAVARLQEPADVPGWLYLVFGQNLGMAWRDSFGPGWLAVTWSLALEWQFYLVFPAVVRYAPPRVLGWVCGAGVLIAPLVRTALPPLAGYVSLPARMDGFLFGAAVALAVWTPAADGFLRANRRAVRAGWWVLLAGCGAMAVRPAAFGAVTAWYGTFTHTWLGGFYAVSVLLLAIDPDWRVGQVLRTAPLRGLGVVSYGVYLLHQPVSHLLHEQVRGAGPDLSPSGAAVTLAAAGATVGLAVGLYYAVETWFVRLGRQVAYHTPAAPTDTPLPAGRPMAGRGSRSLEHVSGR